jgi:pimeloyl-ACP methyl ester carboxylesterase
MVEPGVALNLRDWEGPDGVTALLIHGSAEGGFVWDDFAPELAKHCKVVAVDLRGHGGSDHDPDSHYTLDKHVRDISRLLDELQDELILVGHSLGGDVATKIAPELGRRLRALVLVDSGPDSNHETATYLQDQLRESHRLYERVEEYTQWLRDRRFLTTPAVLERLAAASLILGSDGYRLRYDVAVIDMITAEDDDSWWLPNLRQTSAPVLVVRGMASASLSRRTAERMRAATPKGELAIVPAAGHAVMNDNIEGFAGAVIPFIARTCSPIAARAG